MICKHPLNHMNCFIGVDAEEEDGSKKSGKQRADAEAILMD